MLCPNVNAVRSQYKPTRCSQETGERLLRNVEVGRKTHMSPIVDGFNGAAALATVGTTAPLPRWEI
jgi:hypothetical protein